MNMFPNSFISAPNIADWFKFTDNGKVEMISGKVEIGQGINTAFVQIAAEELDIDPSRIDLTAGDTRTKLDGGCTSGSLSMQTEGLSLRKAASAARVVMLEKASELLQSNASELSVKDGEVFLNGNTTNISYWSLKDTLDLNKKVESYMNPKKPNERRLVGKKLNRIDLPFKVTGKPIFIHDLELDNMLHARVVRPPSQSCRLVSIDTDSALKIKGLFKLVQDGSFVAVVCKREEVAVKVAKQVKKLCRWSKAPKAVADPILYIKNFKGEIQTGLLKGEALNEDEVNFSTEISRQYLCHASIGPCCAIACWNKNNLEVHTHSQSVFPLQRSLAAVFKIDENTIDVIHHQGSGCYGHNGSDDVALDAALIAKAIPEIPVRVQWSREDELSWSPLAPAMVTQANAYVDNDGKINKMSLMIKSPPHVKRPVGPAAVNLLSADYLLEPVLSPNPIDTALDKGGAADRNSVPLYDIPNLTSQKQIIHDLPWRTSAMRGLGAFVNVYAIETLMDDIASELNLDPVQFRLSHSSDTRIQGVIEDVAKLSDWKKKDDGNTFKGIAFSRYKNSGAYCAVVVEIKVDEDIELINVWASVDAGECINPDGIINQIEGGIIQSASCTLIEKVNFENEEIQSKDWETYPIIKFNQVPRTFVNIVNHPDLPFLGVGEAAHGPTAAAISNALRKALGIRIKNIPITREDIVAALNK
jgi:nicotinate dehydrogenase subunit B